MIANGEHLPPEVCLFCLTPSNKFEENVAHMALAHGLFVPEKEYLTDLRGLIVYLGEKIGVGNLCIYCKKTFTSAEAARAHMVLHPLNLPSNFRLTKATVKFPTTRPPRSSSTQTTMTFHLHILNLKTM